MVILFPIFSAKFLIESIFSSSHFHNLYNLVPLVPFVQFKNLKNTHGGLFILVLACNFTKSNTPTWVFFTYVKIVQMVLNHTIHLKYFYFQPISDQCSHFIPPENTKTPNVFWCFQEV